jgi:hypothetical protein
MEVRKCGRTTLVTHGIVTSLLVGPVDVDYGTYVERIAIFEDEFFVSGLRGERFAAPGDSGSIILESKTGRPVGLLFAVTPKGVGVACDLSEVCDRLGVDPV